VRVRRDGGDAGKTEVEGRNGISEPLRPRKDEAPHTAVDVKAEVVLERELGHLLDRIDEAVRVIPGRADDGHGVRCRVLANPVDVGAPVVPNRRLEQGDAEHVRGLLQGDVRGDRDDHLGRGDAFLHSSPLAVDEHRIDQALGAAEGDDAAHLLPRVMLGDRAAIQQRRGHRHDLSLELGRTRVHVALEDVGVGEQPVRLREELVVIVAAVVDRAGDAPGIPHGVLLLGHGPELGKDALVRPRLGGDPVMGLEAVAVRVEVDERSEVLLRFLLRLLLGLLGPCRPWGLVGCRSGVVFLHRRRIVPEACS
jgi:hypothetical protein